MYMPSSPPRDALRPQPGIKRYFHVQRFCFACIGIDPTSLKRTYFSYFLAWFPMMSLFTLSFPILLYAINNIHDLDEVTDSLSPFWQAFLSIFKLMYFMWNSKKLVSLIRKLWQWNLEAENEEHAILAAENRKDILFCKFYHISVVTTGCLALLAPFMIAGFYSMRGEAFWDYLEPPLKAAYFISEKTLLGYIIAYSWNLWGIYYVIYGSVSTDSLFSWFMCNIVAQLHILKHRLRRAGEENNGNCSMRTISDCIAYHCRIIEIANDFNDVFSVVVFIKFMISCIQICCLAFQFSRGGELADQVFHGLFLVSVSMQLILYCYGGQRIQDESESVANQIYESFHWELLSVPNKKMLIVPMLRAQDPCNVSGIFFIADLSLYLWVYRTAASFITLLWTLEEKEEESH